MSIDKRLEDIRVRATRVWQFAHDHLGGKGKFQTQLIDLAAEIETGLLDIRVEMQKMISPACEQLLRKLDEQLHTFSRHACAHGPYAEYMATQREFTAARNSIAEFLKGNKLVEVTPAAEEPIGHVMPFKRVPFDVFVDSRDGFSRVRDCLMRIDAATAHIGGEPYIEIRRAAADGIIIAKDCIDNIDTKFASQNLPTKGDELLPATPPKSGMTPEELTEQFDFHLESVAALTEQQAAGKPRTKSITKHVEAMQCLVKRYREGKPLRDPPGEGNEDA